MNQHKTDQDDLLSLAASQLADVSSDCFFEQHAYNISWKYDKNSDRVTFTLIHRFRTPLTDDVWTGVGIGESMVGLDLILILSHQWLRCNQI